MKHTRNFLWVFFSVIAVTANAQQLLSADPVLPTEEIFALHMKVDNHVVESEIDLQRQRIDDLLFEMKEDFIEHESMGKLVEELFYAGHKKFLKHYRRFTTFNDLLTRGRYDCLTGTIFYAYALDELKIPYEILESPNHIYIVVDEGNYLLESTDPLNGFVAGKDAVREVLANDPAKGTDSEQVTLYQTVGLQYFNAAVEALNQGELMSAVDYVDDATLYYQGERMIQLGLILSRVISESELDSDTKFSYLLKLTRTIQSRVQVVGIN